VFCGTDVAGSGNVAGAFSPVEDQIILELLFGGQIFEKSSNPFVIRGLLEFQTFNIFHILFELLRQVEAQQADRHLDLPLLDHKVPLILLKRKDLLPRQLSIQKVDQHIPNRFQIVPS
jgi:hypothetical protein